MDWRPVQGVPRLSPNDGWDRLSLGFAPSAYFGWSMGSLATGSEGFRDLRCCSGFSLERYLQLIIRAG